MRRSLVVLGAMAGLVLISVLGVGFSSATFHSQSANPANTFTAATSFCSSASTQNLTADRDTHVDQGSPSTTFGSANPIRIQSRFNSRNQRLLVGFTLPSKPTGCSITSATLTLTATSASTGRTLDAYQVSPSASWTESGANWNNQPASAGVAASTTSGTGARQWTVTAQVQAMYGSAGPNNGFLVEDHAEDGSGSGFSQAFSSREASSNKPQLSITFG